MLSALAYSALESIESQSAEIEPEMLKKANQAKFLQTKAREYHQNIEHLKVEVKS